MRIVSPLVGGNTTPGVVAWASRALAVGDAEQAASRSKAADPGNCARVGSGTSQIPSYIVGNGWSSAGWQGSGKTFYSSDQCFFARGEDRKVQALSPPGSPLVTV